MAQRSNALLVRQVVIPHLSPLILIGVRTYISKTLSLMIQRDGQLIGILLQTLKSIILALLLRGQMVTVFHYKVVNQLKLLEHLFGDGMTLS